MVLHQGGQAAQIGLEVLVPVVRLDHGQVEHVVGVGRQAAHVAGEQIDGDAVDPGRLEPIPSCCVTETGSAVDLVLLGQGDGQWLGYLPGGPDDHDLGPL